MAFGSKATAAARPMPVSPPVIKTTGLLMASQSSKIWVLARQKPSKGKASDRFSWLEFGFCWRRGKILCRLVCIPPRHGTLMELRHLRYFVAVAEEGSLTVAAERRLHTAQPSLSRQIRDLEYEVGAQLMSPQRARHRTDRCWPGLSRSCPAGAGAGRGRRRSGAAGRSAHQADLRPRLSDRPRDGLASGGHAHPSGRTAQYRGLRLQPVFSRPCARSATRQARPRLHASRGANARPGLQGHRQGAADRRHAKRSPPGVAGH